MALRSLLRQPRTSPRIGRPFLSLGCVDLDATATAIGTEVIVHWGDHGSTINEVRATVERFPYLADARTSEIDVSTLAQTDQVAASGERTHISAESKLSL